MVFGILDASLAAAHKRVYCSNHHFTACNKDRSGSVYYEYKFSFCLVVQKNAIQNASRSFCLVQIRNPKRVQIIFAHYIDAIQSMYK